jgi:hypothetical protein
MPAAHSTNAFVSSADRASMRRLTIALVVLLIATFALSRLYLLYSHKFYDVTGTAEWIWDKHRVAAGVPLAFFAVRDFELPSNRYYTKIKIVGDPEYTLYFNGVEIGGRRVGEDRWLDVYDVTPIAKTGRNRIVVAVRSENGVGGLIAALDIAPDYQNMIVSGSDWKIYRQWSDRLLLADVPSIAARPPMLLGRPPMRRWNYLERRERSLATPPQKIIQPRSVNTMIGALPEVRVINGVAVTATTRTGAVVYDFGPTRGRARLTLLDPARVSIRVKVRFANDQSELAPLEGNLQQFVFGGGERTIIDPVEQSFRYVMVYGPLARAEVAQ